MELARFFNRTLTWMLVQLWGAVWTSAAASGSVTSGQLFAARSGQRLPVTPLTSVTFSQGRGSRSRCLVWCKRLSACRSINVFLDSAASSIICEALSVYLHQVTAGLTPAANWTFIQEDPIWINDTMALALAFRATTGTGTSVFDTWNQSGRYDNPLDVRGCVLPLSSEPCSSHFRSYILDSWINIDQVLIQLYKNKTVVKEIRFNGIGSNNTSWMAQDRLLSSSWTDMTPTSTSNSFSFDGIDSVYRRFYLSKDWYGCPGDRGWLMLVDVPTSGVPVTGQCPYDIGMAKPAVMFTPTTSAGFWATDKDTADFMMVYVSFL